MKVTIVIEGDGVISGNKPEGHALAAAIEVLTIIGPVAVRTDASSEPFIIQPPMSSATVSENCDRPPAGWACTRQRGHEGPCAAVPRDVVLGSAIVSEPSAGPRDRFNALAEKLVTGLVTYEAVRQALKTVFYEGRREGELAAKETWGEAIEETDKQRAFRVAETLFGDRLISGDRKAVEQRFVEALAESRALGALPYMPRGYNLRWKDETAPDDGTTAFDEELERHRKNVDAARNAGHGNSEQHWIELTDAVWFLLAVAHQPGDK